MAAPPPGEHGPDRPKGLTDDRHDGARHDYKGRAPYRGHDPLLYGRHDHRRQPGPWRRPPGAPLRILRWAAAAVLLSVPWFMMQVSDAWDWRPESFVLFGTMLASALGAYELAVRMSGSWTYRAGAALAIATGFVLVWMNLAVGIIGPKDNPANLMYVGALLVGAVGAAMARLELRGMALASFATALALLLVAALAASFWWNESPGRIGLLILNGTFTAMYLAAAWLFRKAAWS